MPEETSQTPSSAAPADQNPQKGGSYLRQADGSLQQVEATNPAPPQTATDPQQPTETNSQE